MSDTPPMTQDTSGSFPTTTPEVTKRAMIELGDTGLRRWGGYIDEELNQQLRGRIAVDVYREMQDNDAVVGAVLFAVEKLLREATWRVEPHSQDREDLVAAEFLEQCMHDMSHTWEDFISEILSMLTYGWSWHEVVYKRRLGASRNPMFRSEFNDGRISWRKMPIRSQETLMEWDFDRTGGVRSLVQLSPPDYRRVKIPIIKSLLFRTTTYKNNPEGRSILRNAYRSWYFLKRLQEVEGIGIERDLAGLPAAWVPAEFMMQSATEEQRAIVSMFKRLVTSVRVDEQAGLVLPLAWDENGNKRYDFELLSTGGTKQIDTDTPITRYEQRIAMTILADFILLGHEKVGSYSLGISKIGIFRTALNAWAQSIAAVINRHEVPQLFRVNGWTLEHYPQIAASEIDPPSLEELGEYISKLSGAGMPLFPDNDLEDYLRDVAKLPEKPQELVEAEQRREQKEEERKTMQLQMLNGDGPPGGTPSEPGQELGSTFPEDGETSAPSTNGSGDELTDEDVAQTLIDLGMDEEEVRRASRRL